MINDNPVLAAIAGRRSIRSYTKNQVTPEQFDTLLVAARRAPSAMNAQPWHFSVTQDAALLKEISDEARTVLGRDDLGDLFHGAPAAIFLSCDAASRWGRLDCGIAVENIALAAHAIGLGTVILGLPEAAFKGPRGDSFARRLQFPDGYSFAVSIAVGVPAGTKEPHPLADGRVTFA